MFDPIDLNNKRFVFTGVASERLVSYIYQNYERTYYYWI